MTSSRFRPGCYAVLAPVSRSYSPLEGRLVTCYSPGRHCTQGLLPFLVRLACVRHAASVDSEPGSNSRLKPDVCRRVVGRRNRLLAIGSWLLAKNKTKTRLATLALERRSGLSCEIASDLRPNPLSHDWHVQPNCQRPNRDPPERDEFSPGELDCVGPGF